MNLQQQVTVVIEHHIDRYTRESEKQVRTEQFNGTLYQAFYKVEKENERLRYLNGFYSRFADKAVQTAYQEWRCGLTQSQWYDIVGMTCANTD